MSEVKDKLITAENLKNAYDDNKRAIGELKNDNTNLDNRLKTLEQGGTGTGAGLSTEAIDKLEEVGNYLAYTTADGGSKWTELISILRNGSSGGGSSETVPATGITLDKTTLSFTDSTSQTLVATVEPSDTTDKVVWTSNAESVATVTNGVVKPLSNGSATITATCGSVSATCSVTVDIAEEEPVTLTSISASYSGGDVAVGTSLNDLTGITVTAHYSDGSTANVTGYTLSGTIAEGSNIITVSYGGKTTTFTVTGIAESSGGEEPKAFGVSEISSKSIKYNNALISNTTGTEYGKGFKYAGKIVSINVEAGKTYMLMGLHNNLTATMNSKLSAGQAPVGEEPMAVDLNADGTFGEVNSAFMPTYVSLANVDPYKTTGMISSGKGVFWSGEYNAFGTKTGTSFVEAVDGTDYAWCVCIFTANINFCGIVQWSGFTLADENYFRIYEVDPNTEYNPYLDGVIGIGEESV